LIALKDALDEITREISDKKQIEIENSELKVKCSELENVLA